MSVSVQGVVVDIYPIPTGETPGRSRWVINLRIEKTTGVNPELLKEGSVFQLKVHSLTQAFLASQEDIVSKRFKVVLENQFSNPYEGACTITQVD